LNATKKVVTIDIVVFGRLIDLVAVTASHTIKHLMGYGDRLAEVKRADHYRLELSAKDTSQARLLAEQLVTDTLVFGNPNKQVGKVTTPEELTSLLPPPEEGFRSLALVWEREDNTASHILSNLRENLGYTRVKGLSRGVLWFLHWNAPKREAHRLTEEVLVTESRKRGLLSNPHSQIAEII